MSVCPWAGPADLAAARFAERLESEPRDTAAMVGRVQALLEADRWRVALEEAREYAAAASDDPFVLAALGQALFRAGRLEEIEPLLESVVGRSDAPARALLTMGRLRNAQGRYGEAVEQMDRAAVAGNDDRYVMYWSSGATRSRAVAIERLERYLDLSDGDDPDRVEAARGSVRLFRALGERPIWVDDQRPERMEIPLRHLWDPATRETIGYVIEARIGDKRKRVRLLLDTGSPGLYLVDRIARKHGFTELSEQTTFGGGGDRRHATRRGTFDSFAVGELRFRSALATAARHEIDPLGRFHGVLGIAIFNGYRITLDLTRKMLTLDPARETPTDGSPYWVVGGQWLVVAREVERGREGLFLLDTGATNTLLATSFIEGLEYARLRTVKEVHGFGGAIRGARAVDGVELEFLGRRIGPRDLRAVDVSLQSKMGGVEISGFLGLDLLEGPQIRVDTVHRVVSIVTP